MPKRTRNSYRGSLPTRGLSELQVLKQRVQREYGWGQLPTQAYMAAMGHLVELEEIFKTAETNFSEEEILDGRQGWEEDEKADEAEATPGSRPNGAGG